MNYSKILILQCCCSFVLCFFLEKNINESCALNSAYYNVVVVAVVVVVFWAFAVCLSVLFVIVFVPSVKDYRLVTEHVYVVLFLFSLAHRHGRFHQQVEAFELILVVADDAFNFNGGRRVLRVVIAAAGVVVVVNVRICRRKHRHRRRRRRRGVR